MTILLTGSSGYIGTLLVNSWLNSPKVKKIFAIDFKEPKFFSVANASKIKFIKQNVADVDFSQIKDKIDAVVHAAYVIRKPYFKNAAKRQERSNFLGAENIFNFALKNKVKKLVHFSTVAVYGASPENSLARKFVETDPTRENKIAYGRDKIVIERKLEKLIENNNPETQTVVIRLGSVTGPFLKNTVKKPGLQSYLRAFPFIPVTHKEGARQFIHEDDVVRAVNFLLEADTKEKYSVFNLAPEGRLTFRDIAKLSKKIAVNIPKPVANLAFNLMWHLSLGKIPSAPGTINSYSYPIIVDGSKISKLGFAYKYNSRDAFLSA